MGCELQRPDMSEGMTFFLLCVKITHKGTGKEGNRMTVLEQTAEDINTLGRFCGVRDLPALTREALQAAYGISRADVMVLFGGSILFGGDVLAKAMQNGIAETYIIVGGAGHTTEALRRKMHAAYPETETDGLPEAKVFEAYLENRYGLKADFLECESTNCGNNITFLLRLLEEKHIAYSSIILAQDATMQRRMDAGLRKYAPDAQIINYAVYAAQVVASPDGLVFEKEILDMWDMDRYITLLMGEIPRLYDNEDGYGPKGKSFIAHVDIPDNVMEAFGRLKKEYGGMIREANPLFASSDGNAISG